MAQKKAVEVEYGYVAVAGARHIQGLVGVLFGIFHKQAATQICDVERRIACRQDRVAEAAGERDRRESRAPGIDGPSAEVGGVESPARRARPYCEPLVDCLLTGIIDFNFGDCSTSSVPS